MLNCLIRNISSGVKRITSVSVQSKSVTRTRNHCLTLATSSFTKMPSEKPKVVFVLGGPGAGKGTQCQKIVDKYGFVHLSAGDLLREERSRAGSEFGDLIETYIKNGQIVPVEVTCSLLENAMNKNMKELGKNKFLIDGFPRNQDNLDGWNRKMSDKVQLLFVLFFNCSEDTCIQRCLNRGQSGSGRSDDNPESLRKRINTYCNDSLPIINHYKELNLVREINATPGANEVFTKVQEAFKECEEAGAGDQ